tara:strand:+ start:224 stop:604 length:381 start_codon:yes stop_codon:yes gene_type:complete
VNNLLSIDYGERYVGCALRTSKSKVPFPLTVIDSKADDLSKELETVVKEYCIDLIIVGYPIGLNMSLNRMTSKVEDFIKSTLDNYSLPVIKIDERLTSNIYTNNKKERVDDLSALQILESYILQNE